MLIRCLLLASLLVGVPAMAHDMSMSMEHEAALGAGAALAPDGRLWVASVKDRHVLVRHSDDFGAHFSKPVTVNPQPESISASGENRPKIALGPQGDIYVSWTQPLAKPYTGRIRFSRSLDGGRHFSEPVTVHHDKAVITHRFDSLAVDGKGRVLVTWIDKRDLEAAKARGETYAGAAIYAAWSDDRGAHFAAEQKLADHSCECCRIATARTDDGGIGVLWRGVYGDNIRDHAYATLHAGQSDAAARRATFTQWRIAGCPHHGPGLAVDDKGTRHAVWFSAADGKPVIWYGQLDPGHRPHHLQTLAHAGAAHADIAVDGQTVWVAWNQIGADGLTLMRRVSRDGGKHFGAAKALAETSEAAGSPQLLRHHHQVYAAWNTSQGFRLLPVSGPSPQTAALHPLTAKEVPDLLRPPARGKRVIALWALDCVYCEQDLRALDTLHRQHPDIEVISVATDNIHQKAAILKRLRAADADKLPAFAYATSTPERLNYLIDPDWAGVTPHALVIDANGHVTTISGQLTDKQLARLAGTRP